MTGIRHGAPAYIITYLLSLSKCTRASGKMTKNWLPYSFLPAKVLRVWSYSLQLFDCVRAFCFCADVERF